MKTFFRYSGQLLSLSPETDSRDVRRSNYGAATSTCALLLLFLFAPTGVAQTQPSPDPLTVTPQGNVGIGTTAPANKLSVAGNADLSGNVGIGGDIQITNRSKINLAGENHGLRYRYFGSDDIDGPILYGFSGGALGTYRPEKANQRIVLRWSDTGNVSIGTTKLLKGLSISSVNTQANTPDQVVGQLNFVGFDRNAESASIVAQSPGWDDASHLVFKTSKGGDGPVERMRITSDGKVGIGTTPTRGKLEISGYVALTLGRVAYLTPDSVQALGNPPVGISAISDLSTGASVYADGIIAAHNFYAFSDERLKRIEGRSNARRDLATLMNIEVTDYSLVDSVSKGTGMQKKVTGQQVEKVFPQAVFKMTDVVPDIYQKATMKDGWVMLATNLKKGERVRLISEKQEGIHEVLELAEGKFRTAFAAQDGPVFVYGREVNDARSVDYEAISMLNVSATQQIKKEKDAEVKALQEENAALSGQLAVLRSQLAAQEQRLSELEAKDKARDERLAALEALLLAGDKHASRVTSLKKVE